MNDANFTSRLQVLCNGSSRAMTYVNSTQLTAAVQAGDIAQEGTNLVTLANPRPNAATAAASPIAVQSNSPAAQISTTSISGPNVYGDYVLTATGTAFASNYAYMQWSGASLQGW